ncbi:MAG: FkbM family methyltransferase [bacterium]
MKRGGVKSMLKESVKLPNNLEFHFPSRKMWMASRFLIWEIFKKQRYYYKGFEIKQTDTIVDIGANMGLFVMWIAPKVSRGKIIAIEPTESIYVLKNNLNKNSIKNVKTIKAAIGIDGQDVELITYPGFNVINHQSIQKPTLFTRILVNLLTTQWRCKKAIEKVPSVSLDRIIMENNLDKIDFLKLDAEGCEYEIFRNLSDNNFNKIDKIAMEFHEYLSGNSHQELVSILEAKGYKLKLQKPLIDYYLVGRCGFIWAWKDHEGL